MTSQTSWGYPGRMTAADCEQLNCNISPRCPNTLSPISQELPSRLPCDLMRRETVRAFCHDRYVFGENMSAEHATIYPFPIGAASIAQWRADRQRRQKTEPSMPLGTFDDQLMALARPVVMRDDAWLGFAVMRQVHRGGLEVSIPDLKTVQPDVWRKCHIGTIWLLGLVEYIGDRPCKVNFGSGQEDFPEQIWRFAKPVIQTESWAIGASEHRRLDVVERELKAWYMKRALHRNIRSGRRRDSITMPDFPERYLKAYEQLLEELEDRPGALDIALRLGISEATFYRYLARFKMLWPPNRK